MRSKLPRHLDHRLPYPILRYPSNVVAETHALAERVLGLHSIRPLIPTVLLLFPPNEIRRDFGRHDMGY